MTRPFYISMDCRKAKHGRPIKRHVTHHKVNVVQEDHRLSFTKRAIQTFVGDEEGAVTLDFVVLTAAIALMSLTFIPALRTTTTGVASDITTEMQAIDPSDAATFVAK